MLKTKIINLSIAGFLLAGVFVSTLSAAEPTAGAVNYFYNMSGATRVSVDIQPNWGESGYHYYSISSLFTETSYGMYAGIQTIGNLGDGVDKGNIFLFSVWNATQAFPAEGVTATPFGGEGVGYSLRKVYDWNVGTNYRVTMQRGNYDSANNGYRWSASVKNMSSGEVLNLGEILAPNGANTLRGNAVFHERYHGVAPTCSDSSTNLEEAGATFTNLSSDVSVAFSGSPAPNNLFASSACSPYIHVSHTASTIKTGFGISATEFATGGTTSSGGSTDPPESPPPPSPTPGPSPQEPSSPPSEEESSTPSIPQESTQESAPDEVAEDQPEEEPNEEADNTAAVIADTGLAPPEWSAEGGGNKDSNLLKWSIAGGFASLTVLGGAAKLGYLKQLATLRKH